MQVKRFFAADMRIAMKMIRDELGADAVITGNRRVAGGVELTAVLDYPMESVPAKQPNAALEAELHFDQLAQALQLRLHRLDRTRIERSSDSSNRGRLGGG